MKKNITILSVLLFIIYEIFKNNILIHKTILFSYTIFINNIFPNIFPFLVLSNLLINYGFIEICNKLFNKIFKKLFKMSGNASFVFIMSLLTGFPSNSKYAKELYLNNQLTLNETNKILLFTHFSNPLFIIGTISMFLNKRIAYIVLFSHYIGNIIIGLVYRNKYLDKSDTKQIKIQKQNFGTCLANSITNSINTLLLIYGTMTMFLLISSIIQNILYLSDINSAILGGILELTQGIKYVSLLDSNIKIKGMLMTSFLSFGGISVHMQIISIISDTKIKYYPFLIARVIHAFISATIAYILI